MTKNTGMFMVLNVNNENIGMPLPFSLQNDML